MSKKIYVGNMSYSIDEQALNEMFGAYGPIVSTKVIQDQFTGKSKGFAFVEMENEEDALSAISALNGKEVSGRSLKVNEALDNPRRTNNRDNFRRNNRF
jgi:cold-inducible RNA-binding protein